MPELQPYMDLERNSQKIIYIGYGNELSELLEKTIRHFTIKKKDRHVQFFSTSIITYESIFWFFSCNFNTIDRFYSIFLRDLSFFP